MKLKTFNEQSQKTKYGQSKVRVRPEGTFLLTPKAGEAIGIKIGDKISIHQSDSEPRDWFLSKDDMGIAVRLNSKKDRFIFGSAKAAKTLLESCGIDYGAAAFTVSTEPIEHDGVKYFAIITSSAK